MLNFRVTGEAIFSGRRHRRIMREDDGFEFWIDDFAWDVIEMLEHGSPARADIEDCWDVGADEIDLMASVLRKERIVILERDDLGEEER